MGNAATYICGDILHFTSTKQYELWHDRAVFHFLTDKKDILKYVNKAAEYVTPNGFLIIGTFSPDGPVLCSDLEVQQYSEKTLAGVFSKNFETIECFTENHTTPLGGIQNFVFCILKRKVNKQ